MLESSARAVPAPNFEFPEGPDPLYAASMMRTLLVLVWLLASASLLGIGEAAAQRPVPWTPPWSDSLVAWTAQARARFQTNTGDSIGGPNYRAYELVGTVGRHMLASLGRQNVPQVHAIEMALDSLGLDTDILFDEDFPIFVLLMVRNPHRVTAKSVGFLYWFLRDDLRIQGAQFSGGARPQMKVWWSGRREHPYEWAIVDHDRESNEMNFLLLRMSGDGKFWDLTQYPGNGPHLGQAGSVAFIDINQDDRPELVAWNDANPDSTFERCEDCPGMTSESIFVERKHGFELFDSRLMPTPFSTFMLFVRMLRLGNAPGASQMLEDPTKVNEALALGWDQGHERGTWKLEAIEPDETWPRWLRFSHRSPSGLRRYTVAFAFQDARWRIGEWREIQPRQGITVPKAPNGGARPE